MSPNTHPRVFSAQVDQAPSGTLTKTLRWLCRRWAALLLLPLIAGTSFLAVSQGTPPSIPPVVLANDPLYAAALGDKPALALALSVEFPTVGAQYVHEAQATTDASYSNSNEYLGYYDAESCYTYKNAPTETPVAPQTIADFKRFVRSGAATNRMCNNAFSGNFLNWASNSAIDMLRLSLTGGDRYIDTDSLTILQRAVIPNGDPICMWNSSNFPAKQLLRNGGTSGSLYFGAVPTAMVNAAGANDIWVANTLNRIYFGTAKAGGCGNTGSYTLGVAASANQMGTIESKNQSLPAGTTECASENGNCTGFTGTKEIWYGASSSWKVAPAVGSVGCNNTVFGDPIVGTAKKCYYRDYSGSWTPTSADSNLNSDGFFYARVEVCNATAGALQDVRDYGLCKKYPHGNFKPTGAVQKYSDQLRLAAFGYLMDQTASYSNGRYGGVLRAPMKYVGGRTFDINGIDNTSSGGNPKREWDESTGVLIVNPEGDATYGKSGVITYLNQFGRTGPVAGRYKKYDPVGELHYEALRYLQGLQPSPDAISNITADMYDGFPVATAWTDPYGDGRTNSSNYACLKSNIVVIGDINTHDGNRLPAANEAANIPDIDHWRSIVQKFEKKQSVSYVDGQGVERTLGSPDPANNSVPTSTQGSQIMGSAYWAHTHDIRGAGWTDDVAKQRPGLRVKTFVFDVNEYAAQNNVATRRYANQFFMAAKYGGFEADPSNLAGNPYNTKGNPFYRDDMTTVDKYVWEDTDTSSSRVGEANTYFLQSDARGVLRAFDDIFARAATAARSIAGSAIASKSLTQVGSTIYQGTFDTSNWTGDLLALPVTVDSSNVVTIGSTPTWSAATELSKKAPADRKIFVGNAGATANPVATPFTWAVDGIVASLRTALDKSPVTGATDGLAEKRLNYLRGDPADEATLFRRRNGKLLGDIVNSGVAYSGVPSASISASNYASFYATNKTRTAAVFVGANDGMLHAFSATSGEELFAYIPSWLGPKLPALTSPTYANAHQNFADGTPAVAEAEVGSAWKTVLVAGTGGGGRGVFALDVTNPASFDAGKVMWEFTQADDADMGYVIGRPAILKLRTSAPNETAAYKWFALVAGGVNSYVADSAGVYGSGKPSLFLLDLSKGAGVSWSLNSNYYKISFPFDSELSATKATGMVNFKAALGLNGEVAQLFAGDLHGKLWKLDFSKFGHSDWNIGKLSSFNDGNTTPVPLPLYIAKDGSGTVQPITMAPLVAYGPNAQSAFVLFGRGKYLEVADKSSTQQQSVYMVYDDGTSVLDSPAATATSAISGRRRLQAGTSTAATASTPGVVSVPSFVLGRATSDDDASKRSGWYFDFATSGERQVSGAALLADDSGSIAVFSSLIPGTSIPGSCASPSGGGNVYEVKVAEGDGLSRVSLVGILGEPLLSEVSSAATYTPTDNTGRRKKTVTTKVIQQGSLGIPGSPASKTTTVTVGRLSWRQINNYQDLRNATP